MATDDDKTVDLENKMNDVEMFELVRFILG